MDHGISLPAYLNMLNEMVDIVSVLNVSSTVIDNENSEINENKYLLPVCEELHKKKLEYYSLKKQLDLRENYQLSQRLHSSIERASSSVSNLETKLEFLNKHIFNVRSYVRSSSSKQTLSIDKSVQVEFVELVQMLATFCNTLDEVLKLFTEVQTIDWEKVKSKMMKNLDEMDASFSTLNEFLTNCNELIRIFK